MQNIRIKMLLVLLCLVFVPWPLYGTSPSAPPQEGAALPDFSLKVPPSALSRQYLGLNAEGTFKIPEIDAKVVIIEIFSMY